MAGLLEVAASIAADRETTSQIGAQLAASKSEAEELADALYAMGVDGRAEQMQQSVAALEEAEAIRAQLEAKLEEARQQILAASEGSASRTGSASSAGATASVVAAASEAPPPEAGGKGGGEDPPKDPPATPAAASDEPDFTDFSAVNELIGVSGGFDEENDSPPSAVIEVPAESKIDEAEDPDGGSNRFQRFGRIGVRGADDLSQFTKTVEKSANDLGDIFKPPPDPHSYNTGSQVPEPHPIVRAGDDGQTSGNLEWAGTAVVLTVLAAEAASRFLNRKKDD